MTGGSLGVGVEVWVGEGVAVAVRVGTAVEVGVTDEVGVLETEGVGEADVVDVDEGEALGTWVIVAGMVGECVGVSDRRLVALGLEVGEIRAVGVLVTVRVAVSSGCGGTV